MPAWEPPPTRRSPWNSGYDGVLLNTAIAAAEDSVAMATAMKLGVEAGRHAYLAGRMEKKLYASASSPMAGVVR